MLLELITPAAFVFILLGSLECKRENAAPRPLRTRKKLLSPLLEDDISNVLDGVIEGCDVFEFG